MNPVKYLLAVPAYLSIDDTVGAEIQIIVDGSITQLAGLTDDTGTWTAELWSSTGSLLRTATFTGVAGSWVYASITPLAVSANDVYFVSIYRSGGTWGYMAIPCPSSPTAAGNVGVIAGAFTSGHGWPSTLNSN